MATFTRLAIWMHEQILQRLAIVTVVARLLICGAGVNAAESQEMQGVNTAGPGVDIDDPPGDCRLLPCRFRPQVGMFAVVRG